MVMSSPLAGAEITTFLAPALRCLAAASRSVKRPVLSSTSSTPKSFQGSFSGSLMADTLIGLPFTTIASPRASTVPPNRPCTESYLSRWASVLVSVMSFTATNSSADCFIRTAARSTLRPIRPNPLMPTRTAIAASGEIGKDGPTERHSQDRAGARPLQGPRGLGQGGAGGEDVVHQNQCGIRNAECGIYTRAFIPHSTFRIPHFESPRHIRPPGFRCQRRLGRRLPDALQEACHRPPPAPRQRARETLALIVAPLPQAFRAERHRHEPRAVALRQHDVLHRLREVVRDARQAAVLERVHGVARSTLEPHGGADRATPCTRSSTAAWRAS